MKMYDQNPVGMRQWYINMPTICVAVLPADWKVVIHGGDLLASLSSDDESPSETLDWTAEPF